MFSEVPGLPGAPGRLPTWRASALHRIDAVSEPQLTSLVAAGTAHEGKKMHRFAMFHSCACATVLAVLLPPRRGIELCACSSRPARQHFVPNLESGVVPAAARRIQCICSLPVNAFHVRHTFSACPPSPAGKVPVASCMLSNSCRWQASTRIYLCFPFL